jgi:hypothetical protein
VWASGCSSSSNSSSSDPFGPPPDFGHVEAQFSTPTGTFAQGSEGNVISGLNDQKKASTGGFAVGAAPSTGTATKSVNVELQSLKALDMNGGTGFCAALQSGAEQGSCSCPNGGSLAYDMSGMKQLQGYRGGPIDVTMRVRANACAVPEALIDGTEFINIKSSNTPSAQDMKMLFDLHLTVTPVKGTPEKVDADFEYLNGKFWFSVTVNDGNVVVGSETWDATTSSGTLVVRDRSETWTCTFTSGRGTCTSDHGASRDVGL